MSRFARWSSAVALMLLVAGLVAGCGGSGSSSGSSSAPPSESTESSEAEGSETESPEAEGPDSGVAEAKKFVSEHSSLEGLEWPEPPSQPYDAGSGRLGIVICGSAGTGCVDMGEQVRAATKAAGWEPSELGDGKFTPSVQSGLVQKFVQEKVDGIVIVSIDLASIKSAVDAAEQAGIPMACVFCTPSPEFPGTGGPVALTATSGKLSGEYLGNYLVSESEGNQSFFQFVDNAFPSVIERAAAIKKVIEEKCSECTYEEEGIATEELAKPGPPFFTAMLSSHPEVDWAFVSSDPYDIPMVKTAEQQGSEVKIATIDAEPGFLEEIQNGEVAQAVVFSPFNYASWAGVDEVIRQKAGLKPWKADGLPAAIIHTEAAVEEALSAAPETYSPPDFDYEAMFAKLWSGK